MLPCVLERMICRQCKEQSCSCVPPGIFREIKVSRKGAHSCPVATGVVFAVNVGVRGAAGGPLDAYSQDLLASMQARHMRWESSKQPEAGRALICVRAERVASSIVSNTGLWLCQ